jgi:hypothetical protein
MLLSGSFSMSMPELMALVGLIMSWHSLAEIAAARSAGLGRRCGA